MLLLANICTKYEKIPPTEGNSLCRHSEFPSVGGMTNSWADDLEDMIQGQKSLYMTHPLSMVNTCAKYEKDPSSGRKVMAPTWFCLPFLARS